MLLAVIGGDPARAADEPKGMSFHGGVALSALLFPTLQLQLEWPSWFIAVEAGWGLGGWGAVSALAVAKVGLVWNVDLHPYFALGAGVGWAYDGDGADGSGFALTGEAGLMLGHGRSWGRVVPFVEVPVATWSTTSRYGYTWRPGIGLLLGIKLLL
jgi:hypothetical protein